MVRSDKKTKCVEKLNSFYDMKPVFSFAYYDTTALWAKSKDDKPTVDKLFVNIYGQANRMWKEIMNDGKGSGKGTKNHWIKISELSKDAQRQARQINLRKSGLISLRIEGDVRLWGHIEADGIFYVIWYDPNHQVCPSKKKHT